MEHPALVLEGFFIHLGIEELISLYLTNHTFRFFLENQEVLTQLYLHYEFKSPIKNFSTFVVIFDKLKCSLRTHKYCGLNDTALRAASKGEVSIMTYMFEKGASNYNACLNCASVHGYKEVVEAL